MNVRKVRGAKGLTDEDFRKLDEDDDDAPKWFIKLARKIHEQVPFLDSGLTSCVYTGDWTGEDLGLLTVHFIVDNEGEFETAVIKIHEICSKACASIKEEVSEPKMSKWEANVVLDKLAHFSKHGYGRRKKK